MIDNALSVANSRLASLKRAHNQLLGRYTELEIKYIELQAAQEIDNLPMHHGTQKGHHSLSRQGYPDIHPPHVESDGERGHYQSQRTHHYHSEDSLSPHSASYSESTNSNYSGVGQSIHFPSSNQTQSAPTSATANPGYISPGPHTSTGNGKFPGSGGFVSGAMESQQQHYSQHSQDFSNSPPLRHKPSMVDSMVSSGDSQSMKTVTSSTSSEKRREKIKPQSEIRIRGRGQ